MLFKTDYDGYDIPEYDYTFEYGENSVAVNLKAVGGEFTVYGNIDCTMDDDGRILKQSMTQNVEGEDPYGPYVMVLSYNNDGYLEKIESDNSYPWYLTWKDGDIFSVKADRNAPGEEMENFPVFLTEEDNAGYFDYNWIWSEMYNINPFGHGNIHGLLDMTGRRSTHLTKPTVMMYESRWSPEDQSGVIRSENENDSFDREYYTETEVETGVVYLFSAAYCVFDDVTCRFEYDDEGDLTSVVSEMPVTWTQYSETYKVNPHDPDHPDDVIDGENIYYRENVSVSHGEPVPTGKTTQGKQTLTITITY